MLSSASGLSAKMSARASFCSPAVTIEVIESETIAPTLSETTFRSSHSAAGDANIYVAVSARISEMKPDADFTNPRTIPP